MTKKRGKIRYPEKGPGWFSSKSESGIVSGPTKPTIPGNPHLTIVREKGELGFSRHVTRETPGGKEHVRLGALSGSDKQFLVEFVTSHLLRLVPDDEVYVSPANLSAASSDHPAGFWYQDRKPPPELLALLGGFDPRDRSRWVRIRVAELIPGGPPGLQRDSRGSVILVARWGTDRVFRLPISDLVGRIRKFWEVMGVSGFFRVVADWEKEHST